MHEDSAAACSAWQGWSKWEDVLWQQRGRELGALALGGCGEGQHLLGEQQVAGELNLVLHNLGAETVTGQPCVQVACTVCKEQYRYSFHHICVCATMEHNLKSRITPAIRHLFGTPASGHNHGLKA